MTQEAMRRRDLTVKAIARTIIARREIDEINAEIARLHEARQTLESALTPVVDGEFEAMEAYIDQIALDGVPRTEHKQARRDARQLAKELVHDITGKEVK